VAIVQISQITQRKGLFVDLPAPLAGAELGWATDTRQLFIGNGTLQDGAPVVGNTEVLTQFSDILSYATEYTYKGMSGGYAAQTGTSASTPVSQSLQTRLDSYAIITDFGASGDGSLSGTGTDVTANINNALYQLYCRDAANPATRRSLYFPAGVYIISDTLNIPPYCKLYGDGPESTIIYFYVQTWTDTVSYAAGVLVKSGVKYYRSTGEVPIGINIAETIYWTEETLPPYIFRTADSLQQVGVNIGTNGAQQPGSFEISSMKFQTNQIIDGCYIEAAKDCSFESVNISGPETTATITSNGFLNDTACIRWNTTDSFVCNNIEWNHSTFTGMVWGTTTEEEIRAVTFSNCSFDTLYQGIYLGTATPPVNYVGPTGFRLVQNDFNNIYAEGIVIEEVGLNCSAYNIFYDVGNHFLGLTFPYTPVIDLDGTNNISVGDMFQRTNIYSTGTHPRIKLNGLNGISLGMGLDNFNFYQNAAANNAVTNQMSLGTYQRAAGITDVLVDDSTDITMFTFDAAFVKAVKFDYTIVRETAIRTGNYTVVSSIDGAGTGIQGVDDGVQNSMPGVSFTQTETGGIVTVKYSTTSTGSDGTIYYSVTRLA
jgi:hypothetical protein